MTEETLEYREPVIRITYAVNCGPAHMGRNIGFETIVAQNTPADALDELVDRLTHVADRQQAKVDLVEHERQLMILKKSLEATARDQLQRAEEYKERAAADQPGRRVVRLRQQDAANLDVMKKNIEDMKTQVEAREQMIAKCRALISDPAAGLSEAAE